MDKANEELIPDTCIICFSEITCGNSILLSCECVIAMCKNCGLNQIAAQPNTYHFGLQCPCCRAVSHNIKGIEEAQIAEDCLINSAITHWKIRSLRHNSLSNILISFLTSGYNGGTITLLDIHRSQTDILCPKLEDHMLRLEIARLEQKRCDNVPPESNEIPMGPLRFLIYLYITSNLIN